ARRFGVANAFNPKQNVEGGVRYLHYLLELYNGNYPKAIAAYNAGENAVARYGGIPPYPETRNYLYQVAKNLKVARQHAVRRSRTATPGPVETAVVEAYNPIRTSVNKDGKVYYRTP
ncbi:MAG: lytic transglycosylase domain-containing protein, partial [Acidobacteriota bacterium]|nr:lytic transglycosylase domain-containing protein [Acidobacteriota bacterium]